MKSEPDFCLDFGVNKSVRVRGWRGVVCLAVIAIPLTVTAMLGPTALNGLRAAFQLWK